MKQHIRASDATAWVKCRRRAWFGQQTLEFVEAVDDAFEQLIIQAGEEHELQVLSQLAAHTGYEQAIDAQHTQALMQQGVRVIYQPVAQNEQMNLLGRPDFLILEGGEYRVADAKLAASIKARKDIQIQVALYRRLFASQTKGQVYLGNGDVVEVGEEADALADQFLSDMAELAQISEPPDANFSYSKCTQCPYREICIPEFEREKTLTLLYRLDPRSVPGLRSQGIYSIEDLANADWRMLDDVPYLRGETARRLMVERAQVYLSGQWRLIERPQLPQGTWVHFDVESNPLADNGGQVYLWGFLLPSYGESDFEYLWSEPDDESDLQTWLNFLQRITELRAAYPDLILAHYGHFEVTQIRAYATRYDMFDHVEVDWLLGNDSPLFDLFAVTKRCLLLPLTSYGLKAICKAPELVNFQWQLEESGSQWSVVQYIRYADSGDEAERHAIQQEILSYNRDDVRATRALEEWLRELA